VLLFLLHFLSRCSSDVELLSSLDLVVAAADRVNS
jgi:hypothetical protein